MSNRQHNLNPLIDGNRTQYASTDHHKPSFTPSGTCFIGGGIPRSRLRKISSAARFSKLDVIARTFTSKVKGIRKRGDETRVRVEKAAARLKAIQSMHLGDREFYTSR